MTPGKLVYVAALATGLALAVVWQSAALCEAGYRLEELEAQAAEQEAEGAIYESHLSKLKNPQRILGLVAWLGLDLREKSVAQALPSSEELEGPKTIAALTDQLEPSKPQAAAEQSERLAELPVTALSRF
ncbi:MAG: hypothetical protein ACYS8L_05545 [Planctomycetota bacterium]|jgi:uncharacterized coiled-coil protein SlyX